MSTKSSLQKSLFPSNELVNQVEYCLVCDFNEENTKITEEIVAKQKRFLFVTGRPKNRILQDYP